MSDSAHVGHSGVTFVIVRAYVKPMLGECWPNVGPFGGFWLAYVGPDIPIFVGHECEGLGALHI